MEGRIFRGIISLIYIIICIISIIGLVWLTKFAFNAKIGNTDVPALGIKGDSIACVEGINKSKINASKVSTVTLWIQICVSLITAIVYLFMK